MNITPLTPDQKKFLLKVIQRTNIVTHGRHKITHIVNRGCYTESDKRWIEESLIPYYKHYKMQYGSEK
jgi:hypothetical protein